MKYKKAQGRFKKTLLTLCTAAILASPLAFADSFTVDRLSLFINDGTSTYEDRRLNQEKINLPSNLSSTFSQSTGAHGESIWRWQIKNTGRSTFNNLRLTGLIDLDIDAQNNTFFNEHGELLSLDVPQGYLAPDRWEVGEPGYFKGDLIHRAAKGNLQNRSDLTSNHPDDPSMALSLPLDRLYAGEAVEVTAVLGDKNLKNGLLQTDGMSLKDYPNVFQFYAKKIFDPYGVIGISQNSLITTGTLVNDAGEVWMWGFRNSGQQGNGSRSWASNAAPEKVKGLQNIKFVTGGAYHLLALSRDGDLYGWGQSGYGETGCQPTTSIYVASPCKVLGDITQVGVGEYFSVALDNQGQVWTFGHNLYGQLGNGERKNSQKPVAVNLNGEKARLIGGAYEGAFAVTEEGHVWAWGDNEASGLGFQGSKYGVQSIVRTPTRVPNLEPYAKQIVYIAGGNGWGEALLDDGTVIGWGLHASLGIGVRKTNISSPEPVVIMKNVKQLFARYVGSFALTHDGEIYTWGQTGGSAFPMIYGDKATLRSNTHGKVVAIGGGKEHLFYRSDDGNLYGVGYNDLYKINQSKCCAPVVDWPGVKITVDK